MISINYLIVITVKLLFIHTILSNNQTIDGCIFFIFGDIGR